MARDDFSARDKQVIAARVRYQCSHPECNAMTVGPDVDSSRHFSIGAACHIAAASPGGPRYDESMTEEQRKHPDNGIWMCRSHSTEIDENKDSFPADLLKQWKKEAEDRTRRRMGKATKVDTVSPEIVQFSQATHYDNPSYANLESGRSICSAIAYDFSKVDPTSYATGAFVLRFAILKSPTQKSITLFEIKAVILECEPIPTLLPPSLSAYPHTVFPYILKLAPPTGTSPRVCTATHFCPPGRSDLVPFAPLLIDDDEPQIIDVRFTAETPGVYQFALEAVVMQGVEFQTFRITSPLWVLFEPQLEEFDPLLGI